MSHCGISPIQRYTNSKNIRHSYQQLLALFSPRAFDSSAIAEHSSSCPLFSGQSLVPIRLDNLNHKSVIFALESFITPDLSSVFSLPSRGCGLFQLAGDHWALPAPRLLFFCYFESLTELLRAFSCGLMCIKFS